MGSDVCAALAAGGVEAAGRRLHLSPFELVVVAALETRVETAEVAALRARVRELERQVELLREVEAEATPALPAPAQPAEEGRLGHPWRALFDLLSDAAPGPVSCAALAHAGGERDPEAAHRLVTRLRRRLAPMGFDVEHRAQGGYALVTPPDDA